VPQMSAQADLDPSRPIASAVLAGKPNSATYGKIGNLNWDTTQAATRANLNSITQFSGNPDVQKLMSIFEAARAEYIKLDKELTTARVDLDAKQAKYNSDPNAANAQALELAVKAESDLNKKMDTQNQILSAVAPVVTIKASETIAAGGQRPLVLGENKGVVDRATETAQNEPSYRAITGSVSNYVAGIKATPNLESIITAIKTSPASGQRKEDADGDGFDDTKQRNIDSARTEFNKAPEDVSKLINYAQKVQESFNDYKPVTEEFKANVLGEVLNGSWERNAINDIAGKGGLIDSETQARMVADTAEAQERIAGDAATLLSATQYTDKGLSNEAQARISGDAATLLDAKQYTDKGLNAEAQERIAGDAATLLSATQYTDKGLSNEAQARISGDAATLLDAKQYTDKGLNAEAQERIAGDAATLLSAKQYTDKGLSDEAQARITGDSQTLSTANAFTTQAVSAESENRQKADLLLDEKIVKEADDRKAAIIEEAKQRIAAIEKEEKSRIESINAVDKKFTEQVDGLGRRVLSLENRMNSAENILRDHETRLVGAEQNIQQLQRGVAMAAALQTPVIEYGSNNAMKFSMANYGGENGFSFGYARRLFKGFSADIEAASTSQFEEAVVRGGINFSW